MEIESYEEYHIGNKLHPSINLDYLSGNLMRNLRTHEYEIYEITDKTLINPMSLVVQRLATKNNIKVELNRISQALNVVGQNPEEVTQTFMEVTNILTSIGFETSLFYEIITTIITRSNIRPIDILNNSVSLNRNSLNIDNISNNIVGIRIGGENEAENKQFTLSIEPNFVSPNNRFLIRLQYRSKDINDIESFYISLNEKIEALV